jgi:hypothetical protein
MERQGCCQNLDCYECDEESVVDYDEGNLTPAAYAMKYLILKEVAHLEHLGAPDPQAALAALGDEIGLVEFPARHACNPSPGWQDRRVQI